MLGRVAAHLRPAGVGAAAAGAQPNGEGHFGLKDGEDTPKHPPLGSLEGPTPALRAWTVAQLGTESADGRAPADWPAALAAGHAAVEQFRKFGYVAITDAVHPAALARITAAFKKKQAHAHSVYETSMAADTEAGEAHRASKTYRQMYDLPREVRSRQCWVVQQPPHMPPQPFNGKAC